MPCGTSACSIGTVGGVGVGREVKKLALELCNRKEKKNEMTATSQG